MKNNLKNILLCGWLALSAGILHAQAQPSTWAAQDALGRRIGSEGQYGPKRPGKTVGMFFVVWHGAHGYDHAGGSANCGVIVPTPADSMSPYDNQKIIDANPSDPQYGPVHAMHYWGEPYLGYYTANDEWVIRKHAQMLTDAGVDVIIIDMTNEVIYLPIITKIFDTYTQMRREGSRTPQISCVFHTLLPNGKTTLKQMYDNIYAKGLYEELWFRWKGKPLVFCPRQAVSPEMEGFFTTRHCWFDAREPWFYDGHHCCPWADVYPQDYGWDEDPAVPEMMSVAPATHPTDRQRVRRIGRSFHDHRQPEKGQQRPEIGLCFSEQFSRAMELDPEFVFFAGWNEWTAMRFINEGDVQVMADKPCKVGDSFFCDDYSHEYSRDLEPLRGGFGDNYYYQLADFIRRYKGVDPVTVQSDVRQVSLDDPSAWEQAKAVYADDRGDVTHRDHFGYGRIGQYVNTTGRNDIVEARVANDGQTLYFYARTASPLTPCTDPRWMRLFIGVCGSALPDWEGFQYRVNGKVSGQSATSLERSRNGWNWADAGTLSYRASDDRIVVAVPMEALGIGNPKDFALDFKWIDNAVAEGDIQECLSDGDTAPNGRFRYQYVFKKR